MLTRRLPLLGIVAAFALGACSSSDATTTAVTQAPVTQAATTTSVAPTTAAPTTAAAVTSAATSAPVNSATIALVSSALVSQTKGKLAATDATCIATGMLAKYDLATLAALQSGPVSPEVAATTAAVIEGCVGADRVAEVVTALSGG